MKNLMQLWKHYTSKLKSLKFLFVNCNWKEWRMSVLSVSRYHDQIAAIELKIPPQEVQIPFKWKDAFDKGGLFGGRVSLSKVTHGRWFRIYQNYA